MYLFSQKDNVPVTRILERSKRERANFYNRAQNWMGIQAPVAAVCQSIAPPGTPPSIFHPPACCWVMVPIIVRVWIPIPTPWVPPSTTCCAARSRKAALSVATLA